jgi:murein L,D-transpeptidase YcbB/YkuD
MRPSALAAAAVVLGGWLAQAGVAAPASAPGPQSEALRLRVDELRYAHDLSVRGERIILADTVATIFEDRQFAPAWSGGTRLDHLIAALRDVELDGLDPADYHYEALQALRAELRSGAGLPATEQADLELLATDAMALALFHLYGGKVDPVKLSTQWNYPLRPVHETDARELLTRAIDSGRIVETFIQIRPEHVWYRRGREHLREYRRIAATGGWPDVPDGPTLKAGMTDPRVPVLRRRLEITGDLGVGRITEPELFDPSLEQAVRHFQTRHGMTADGAVGAATRAAMNVPAGARVDQLRVNLERGRWVLHEIKGEFVLVDIAGFNVVYFRNDEPIWTSKVVVGRPYRETPVFRSEITYVVLNPTWTIPPGILAKDTLPAVKRDPGYLARHRIRVIDSSGGEVSPWSVDWSRYGNSVPYQLRQDPGPDNSLGLVKIMFPNPYLVYLHDSPAKSLYDRDERAFSSGCIRVARPFELTELVLNDAQQWNAAAIQEVIATGKTRTVNLAKPVPVLILYWTAQPTPDGQILFRNDVYGRDSPTLAALDEDFRLPPVAVEEFATAAHQQ